MSEWHSYADCDEALANLYQYLDAELETVSVNKIKGHLDECPECMHSFAFEQRLKEVVRERLSEEVPDDFITRLRNALAEESPEGC